MPFTRRALIVGCIPYIAALRFSRAWAGDSPAGASDNDILICSTDEAAPQGPFEIDDFAAQGPELQFETIIEEFRITDFGTAMLDRCWRRRDGLTPNAGVVTLGCFLMSGSASERNMVQEAARCWLEDGVERLLQLDFDVPMVRSQIRIMVGASANKSCIGRDALRIPKNQPTLHLKTLAPGMIQHEFGHALGLLHEHLHPGFKAKLRETVIIAEMSGPPNYWDEVRTRLNLLNRFGTEAQCIGDPQMNPTSIMMYDIPHRWTVTGERYKRANRIQPRDLRCIRGLYSIGA